MKFRFSRTILIALFACAILAASASVETPCLFAQTPSQSTPSVANIPHTITLADAIQMAIARNYFVRTAGNNAESSNIEVSRSEDNAWLPTATATGQWNYTYDLNPVSARTILIAGIPVTEPPSPAGEHSLSYDASASYNLFNGGADAARIHRSEASFGSAKNTFTWTRQNIAFQVTGDYLNVLRTDELVTAADSTLAEGMAQLSLVQGQYQAGVVAIGNLYQQQAVVSQDSLGLIQARNNYQNSEATLLFDLNIPPNEYGNYTFNATGIDTSTSPAARAAIDTTVPAAQLDQSVDRRPDILAQQQAIQASLYDIDVTRGALLPRLDLSGGVSGSGSNQTLSNIPFDNRLDAGLSLSIPIFDGMQSRLLIQEQEVTVENNRINLEQDVQQIRSAAAQAINNLKAADLALDATASELTSANESLRLASERLRVGAGTEVDVIVAEAAVETARVNRVNAKYNWVLAQQQLAYTLGKWHY